ncbi:hypothetical protein BV20DRAFT_368630 [Pilatotrama ljubarskyi]|nr:hypothetical protein BV20DRAFT_368630 [Pilatotrama ljubarskyi]
MEGPQAERAPTVNDLRVKLCYICREEEIFDNPEDPPRAWTHPCSCTLVAHESCLLQWVKSAQQDPNRVQNALKCPQCGAQYELESDNPLLLRVLNAINGLLSTAGKVATVAGCLAVVGSFGLTVCVISTSYGAFAVKEFLGEEMFNLLLTDDPSKWPWHAFIHLPVIPFSLILSRIRLFDTFPLVPLLLTWATTPPIRTASTSFGGLWALTGKAGTGAQAAFYPALNWPPTPFMAMVLFPLIRSFYRRAFDRLSKLVLGSANVGDAGLGRIRRVIWALHDDGPAHLRVRVGANIERPQPEGQALMRRPGDGNANGAGRNANANAAAAAAAAEGADAPENPAEEAERTLHVTTASLGRFVGGALLIPTISNRMGRLLFRLSKHSTLLRAFLAIRDRPAAPLPARIQLFDRPPDSHAGLFRQIGSGLAAGIHIMCGGTPTWNQHDPVWWRNAVGLGIFVFAKDCIWLLHLWLTKRELESRRVKSRSFAGVDIRELDLIQRGSDTQVQPAHAQVEAQEIQSPTQAHQLM